MQARHIGDTDTGINVAEAVVMTAALVRRRVHTSPSIGGAAEAVAKTVGHISRAGNISGAADTLPAVGAQQKEGKLPSATGGGIHGHQDLTAATQSLAVMADEIAAKMMLAAVQTLMQVCRMMLKPSGPRSGQCWEGCDAARSLITWPAQVSCCSQGAPCSLQERGISKSCQYT